MNITEKQLVVLKEIATGHRKGGSFIDLDTILDRMPAALNGWKPTKQTMQFVIRALVRKGLIEKCELRYRGKDESSGRRGASVRTFKLTSSGAFELSHLPGASARAEVADLCMSAMEDPKIDLAIETMPQGLDDLAGGAESVSSGIE